MPQTFRYKTTIKVKIEFIEPKRNGHFVFEDSFMKLKDPFPVRSYRSEMVTSSS